MNCNHCQKGLKKTARKTRKYCSQKCYGQAQIYMPKYLNLPQRMRRGQFKVCPACKKEFYLRQSRINTIFFCSRKCFWSVSKPWNFKDGKSNGQPERKTARYKVWRMEVFKRDKFTCGLCNKTGGDLHAHHIKAFSRYPQYRFDISNGKTLCVGCHKLTDTYGVKAYSS